MADPINVGELNSTIIFQPYCGTTTPEEFFEALSNEQKPASMKGVMYVQSIENNYRIYFYLEDHWLMAESESDLIELVNSLKKPDNGIIYPNENIWDNIETLFNKNNDTARALRDLLQNGGGGYILPAATFATLGGVKIGEGIDITEDGIISISNSNVVIDQFTTATAGIVPAPGDYDDKLLFSDGTWRELYLHQQEASTAITIRLESKGNNALLRVLGVVGIEQASSATAGLMSAADKIKLDGLETRLSSLEVRLDNLTSIEGVEF